MFMNRLLRRLNYFFEIGSDAELSFCPVQWLVGCTDAFALVGRLKAKVDSENRYA